MELDEAEVENMIQDVEMKDAWSVGEDSDGESSNSPHSHTSEVSRCYTFKHLLLAACAGAASALGLAWVIGKYTSHAD